MGQFTVIFDTNAYRDLVKGKSLEDSIDAAQQLCELEDLKDIKRSGSVIVGMEMLAHLTETSDEAGQECFHGLIAYGMHCSDKENGIAIFPHAVMHILNSYLDGVPDYLSERVRNMSGIIAELKNDKEKALKKYRELGAFTDIMNYIEAEEKNFSTLMIGLLTGITDEIKKNEIKITKSKLKAKTLEFIENSSFEPMAAIAIIAALADKYGVTLSDEEVVKRAYNFHMNFPIAVGFYRWVLSTIVNDEIDMNSKKSKKKRWNWLWDYNVCFALNDKINGREVIVVTSDKEMKKVAVMYGYENRLLTFAEYCELLKS